MIKNLKLNIEICLLLTAILTILAVSFGYTGAANQQSGNVEIKAEVPEISEEKGFLNLSGVIKKFSVKNQLFEYKNLVFYTDFQNTGEQNLKPQGQVIIKNWFGKEIERLQFNQDGLITKANEVSQYQTIWSPANILGAGKYSADLVVNYGTTENLNTQIHFWIFPWKVTAFSIIYLIALILISKITQWPIVKSGRVIFKPMG